MTYVLFQEKRDLFTCVAKNFLKDFNSPDLIGKVGIIFLLSAERIDVWAGAESLKDPEEDIDGIEFEYIGYITLSNNENTKFKCRELKTISIPFSCPTRFVKLTLYQNHVNNLNVYNQVHFFCH